MTLLIEWVEPFARGVVAWAIVAKQASPSCRVRVIRWLNSAISTPVSALRWMTICRLLNWDNTRARPDIIPAATNIPATENPRVASFRFTVRVFPCNNSVQ